MAAALRYPGEDDLLPAFREMLAAAALDPYRLWQSFVHFKRLPSHDAARAASAVYSSQIEGSRVELRQYLGAASEASGATETTARDLEREMREGPPPSWWKPAQAERRRVEALEAAYALARRRTLSEDNLLEAHARLAQPLTQLSERQRGQYRHGPIRIVDSATESVVYTGCAAGRLQEKMARLFEGIRSLQRQRLTVEEAFYHAALAHLVFEKIHPFADGNGRVGRLLEKWLLAEALEPKAWKVPTEEFYRKHLQRYYDGLQIGRRYDRLDYASAPPFLVLPVAALAFGRERARAASRRRRSKRRTRPGRSAAPSADGEERAHAERSAWLVNALV